MPHNENGKSVPLRNKVGSGLTISAIPLSKEADQADHSENGNKWDHDKNNDRDHDRSHDRDIKSEPVIDCDAGNADDCTESVSVFLYVFYTSPDF